MVINIKYNEKRIKRSKFNKELYILKDNSISKLYIKSKIDCIKHE